MVLKFPVASSLYGMNSTHADIQYSSQFRNAKALTKKRTYKNYMPFIKYGASIIAALIGLVFNCVINIFARQPIAQIRSSVIIPISVYMANYHTRRTGSDKRFSYHGMDILGCLGPILRSLLKRYRQVMRSSVRFSNKPFTVFGDGNSTKVANFIPIMTRYGSPKFRSICHG